MNGDTNALQGAALTTGPIYAAPKTAHINTVANGFTVQLQGGKKDQGLISNTQTHVAKTLNEAIELVSKHLEE